MKYFSMVAVLVLLLAGFCQAAENQLQLQDDKDKHSYGVGYRMGQDFRKNNIPVNPDAVRQGIIDGLGGEKSMMTDDEMNASLKAMQQQFNVANEARTKELGEKNLETSNKYLQDNAAKEGVKTLPSGLQYKVVTEGQGKSPKLDDTVVVNYKGSLINGFEFDSTAKRGQPMTLQVNRVIKGWQEALQLMKEGDKWQLFIPPSLGYGESGAGNVIPPNSVLIFDVELLSIKPKEAPKQ